MTSQETLELLVHFFLLGYHKGVEIQIDYKYLTHEKKDQLSAHVRSEILKLPE